MKKKSFVLIMILTTLSIIAHLTIIPGTRASPTITEFFDDLEGFNAAAGSPPVVVDFDDIPPNTDITGFTIQGVTFDSGPAPSAPLIVVRGEDTYTPQEGWTRDEARPWHPIRPDNKLFATTGENVLSPGGVQLAPGSNPELENDDLVLTLSTPVSAIGFDILYQALDGSSYTAIKLLDATGSVLSQFPFISIPGEIAYYPSGVPGGSTFVGFVSDSSNIAKIIINEFDGDNDYPDSNIGLDTLRLPSLETLTVGVDESWRRVTDMPTPRADLAVAVVNGRIYAIGGFNGIQNLATMEEYDPATDTWRSRAPMPTARGWVAATAVNGKIYVIGGWDGTNYLPTVEEYDPATNIWRPRSPMPTHRYGLAVVAVGGRIFAIGGQNEIAEGYQKTVEEYDPATDTWLPRADMQTPRYGLTAGVVRGRIYAMGGFNAIDGALATVEEYDPIHNTWRPVSDMPTAQISLAASIVGGRLYAVGGLKTYPSPVEEYDPLIDTWISRISLPTPRSGLVAAVVRGRLYAIGGFDGNRRLSTVEEYDPPFYDTDGDGFADDDELRYGRDPLVPEKDIDTDGDGLLDLAEVTKYGTNPWVPDAEVDTDGDGLANVAEVDRYGTNPFLADADADTDEDGLANVAEVDRYRTNPTVVDTDGDGLGDGEEVLTYETDPLVMDTDGDTYSDGAEVAAGTNPLDPAVHPSTTTGTVTDTATMDTPAAFIPGFTSVDLGLALACLVVLARRRRVTKR